MCMRQTVTVVTLVVTNTVWKTSLGHVEAWIALNGFAFQSCGHCAGEQARASCT